MTVRLFFDHILSHFCDRNTRRQRKQKRQRGCGSERKGLEITGNVYKLGVFYHLGQCRKMSYFDKFEIGRNLIIRGVSAFELHSNL